MKTNLSEKPLKQVFKARIRRSFRSRAHTHHLEFWRYPQSPETNILAVGHLGRFFHFIVLWLSRYESFFNPLPQINIIPLKHPISMLICGIDRDNRQKNFTLLVSKDWWQWDKCMNENTFPGFVFYWLSLPFLEIPISLPPWTNHNAWTILRRWEAT